MGFRPRVTIRCLLGLVAACGLALATLRDPAGVVAGLAWLMVPLALVAAWRARRRAFWVGVAPAGGLALAVLPQPWFRDRVPGDASELWAWEAYQVVHWDRIQAIGGAIIYRGPIWDVFLSDQPNGAVWPGEGLLFDPIAAFENRWENSPFLDSCRLTPHDLRFRRTWSLLLCIVIGITGGFLTQSLTGLRRPSEARP